MDELLSLEEVTKRCKAFLSTTDKPNIVPEYHRLHEGIGTLRLWQNESDDFQMLHFPIRGDAKQNTPTKMKGQMALDRADVLVQLDKCMPDNLVVYDREEDGLVYVVDVGNRLVIKIPHMVLGKSWCVRNVLGTLNPTPPQIYGHFFDSLKDEPTETKE